MSVSKWMSAVIAAMSLLGCGRQASTPPYPYDLPRAGEKNLIEVDIVGATSGSTLETHVAGHSVPLHVHLSDVMAPVKGQPWSSQATSALDALTRGKHARIRIIDTAQIGDAAWATGRVYVDNHDISWELVGTGNAWFREGKSNDQALKNLEVWAREQKKGLWSLPQSERLPPWEFLERQVQKETQQSRQSTPN